MDYWWVLVGTGGYWLVLVGTSAYCWVRVCLGQTKSLGYIYSDA